MLRYAITDRASFPGSDQQKNEALLILARRWSADGVNYVQLREKSMGTGELLQLARLLKAELNAHSRLLINGRADIALAAGVDGVHLTGHPDELVPEQVRTLFASAGAPEPFLSVSCHSAAEAERARMRGADLVLFGPVFEKSIRGNSPQRGIGLAALEEACAAAAPLPVIALGGISHANAPRCVAAGAAGIAGIRMFFSEDGSEILKKRPLPPSS